MTETGKTKYTKRGKKLTAGIVLTACFFMPAGAAMNLWSGKKMRTLLSRQFNEQQLIIAHNIKSLIERELNFLKKEISLVAKEIHLENFDPEVMDKDKTV